jgi:hypothetical protein
MRAGGIPMVDDLLWGDNSVPRPQRRPRPGGLMIASIACLAIGSFFVAFFTIDIGFVLKERHIWSTSHNTARLIPAFLLDLTGGFWVSSGLDFWRVRPVRAVVKLAAGVAAIASLSVVPMLFR